MNGKAVAGVDGAMYGNRSRNHMRHTGCSLFIGSAAMTMNLVQHRSGPSVWQPRRARVSWSVERWIASVAAGGLFVAGVRNPSAARGAMVALSGVLGWWALAGPDLRPTRRGQRSERNGENGGNGLPRRRCLATLPVRTFCDSRINVNNVETVGRRAEVWLG